ncbi:MAG: hypothetical protein PHO15_08285 [Eubacteriales bacterium]|nr:hypothetical protein [Eubacteriales bacterium]
MNTKTGELLSAKLYAEMKKNDPERAETFKAVPDELENTAMEELKNRDRAIVDLKKSTPLTKWANEQNAKKHINKRRIKNKMAKASRKQNRGK